MKQTTEFEVQIHETGPDLKARVKTLLNYMQSTADRHSLSLGTSVSIMSEQNLTWVYTRFYAVIERYPDLYEKINCRTWRSVIVNELVSREFILSGCNGEVLARATASLALIDRTTRKPVPIPESVASMLEYKKDESISFIAETIEQKGDFDYLHNIKVRFDDIDINEHMNNASYAGLLFESIYDKFRERKVLKSIDIFFRGEVIYGDDLECGVAKLDDSELKFFHRLFNRTKGRVAARAVTEWVNKI